jgi:DNA-binding NtrC family response regulator
VLVLSAGQPASRVLRVSAAGIELGRDHPVFAGSVDGRLSRRHARVRWDGRRFEVTDLGSRNGTSVDGVPLRPDAPQTMTRLLRVGDSILVPARDVEPHERLGVRVADGRVEGPTLQLALRTAAHAARLGSVLHITGESGAGKEGLARAFHAAGPARDGPFQAVNCAAIPEGVAERLLFGAKRGAYSGADADADGYVQAAHGGTLFLDEVAELSLAVQAKLLRFLETREVLPLGAARPRQVDLRFCSATHRDLRALVAAGKLREDLYFRIAAPHVAVPPLRDRPEEIPFLVAAELARVAAAMPASAAVALTPHPSLLEACLLRVWPGNVRELAAEIRSAAQSVLAADLSPEPRPGGARAPKGGALEGAPRLEAARVEARHLRPLAGSALAAPPPSGDGPEEGPPSPPAAAPSGNKARITLALKLFEGNVSAAARELGVHRTQLRRWMDRYGLEARMFAPSGRATRDDD